MVYCGMKNKAKLLERFQDAVQAYFDFGNAAGLAAKKELRDEIGDEAMLELADEYRKRKAEKND